MEELKMPRLRSDMEKGMLCAWLKEPGEAFEAGEALFEVEVEKMTSEVLAEKTGVGAVPGSSFFREDVNHLIRFHFAKKESTLDAALERLMRIRETIPPKK